MTLCCRGVAVNELFYLRENAIVCVRLVASGDGKFQSIVYISHANYLVRCCLHISTTNLPMNWFLFAITIKKFSEYLYSRITSLSVRSWHAARFIPTICKFSRDTGTSIPVIVFKLWLSLFSITLNGPCSTRKISIISCKKKKLVFYINTNEISVETRDKKFHSFAALTCEIFFTTLR